MKALIPIFLLGGLPLGILACTQQTGEQLLRTDQDHALLFQEPEKLLIYSARTEGNEQGEEIEGVDRYFEATGDIVSAVFRIIPHISEPERYQRVTEQMNGVTMLPLWEYQDGEARPVDEVEFPPVGKTDLDLFENNLLEIMQFVFNHTFFDPDNELDQWLGNLYEPLGVAPGQPYDPDRVTPIDGKRVRALAERITAEEMAKADRLAASTGLFQSKGEMNLVLLLFQSVFGPIGQPAQKAVYPAIMTTDGEAMNAPSDYVIRMSKDDMPPRAEKMGLGKGSSGFANFKGNIQRIDQRQLASSENNNDEHQAHILSHFIW